MTVMHWGTVWGHDANTSGQTLGTQQRSNGRCDGERVGTALGTLVTHVPPQVVPVAARLLLELFSGELSWSADSVPLQISQPDLKDALVEQFKELHHLWQQQQRPEPGPRPPL